MKGWSYCNLADIYLSFDIVLQFLGHHRLRKELATYRPVIQISAIGNRYCDTPWYTVIYNTSAAVSLLWYTMIQCSRCWTLLKVLSVFPQVPGLYVGVICNVCCLLACCTVLVRKPMYSAHMGVAPHVSCAAPWINTRLLPHIFHGPG